MKILRILLLLLLPAIGFVGCKKSEVKPRTHDCGTANSKETEAASDSYNRGIATPVVIIETGTDIVGSGDDDREGGDRKKKPK